MAGVRLTHPNSGKWSWTIEREQNGSLTLKASIVSPTHTVSRLLPGCRGRKAYGIYAAAILIRELSSSGEAGRQMGVVSSIPRS